MERIIKNAINRHSDQKYYLTQILCEKWLSMNPNPKYTEKDNKKKLEIFDIPNNKVCFVTGGISNGTGDHIYEINNYYKYTGQRGINDQWNIVPILGSINKSYKKIKIILPNGLLIKKDIGYQELTEEEQLLLCENNRNIYTKIQAWKQYATERGAKLSFIEPIAFNNIRKEFHKNYNDMWEITLKSINNT